ncbi:sensor histidine kinase [Mycolicibacterium helvum]|uniref:histidine kinase n=1 Tax=Mycolicibacterium helvum TaxID=1534349 RepID=A0A7I7T7Q9_9MYCO|nr:HAMP domain-containing sensor histidine kinase [Mycolicibacterium helvum]BBY65257.1 two-component sensor histidine kinase [Mycolicibacterium helvum]
MIAPTLSPPGAATAREPEPGIAFRLRHPSAWSLQVRLLALQVALLALVCIGIGAGTLTAMHRFLLDQLDAQVVDAATRSALLYAMGPPPPMPGMVLPAPSGVLPAPSGAFFLNAPGQSAGTLGALLSEDGVLDAAVVTDKGSLKPLSERARREIAATFFVRPSSITIDGLGAYRVIASPARNGRTIVTGLPTKSLDETQLSLLVMLAVMVAGALAAAIMIGLLILRRQLTPLSAVAATAQRVADSDLDHGEVRMPMPSGANDSPARYTEVGRLRAAFDRMLQRIGDAMTARHASETRVRQFVADASHELRTPLAAIRGYTELVQREQDDFSDDVVHALSRIDSEAKRMSRLVEDMLLLARLDAGRSIDNVPVDLSQLTINAVSDAHVAGRDHSWDLRLPDEPVVMIGDGARLHQVLANLLSNARVHTPGGTTVTTSLRKTEDEWIIIEVTDDGPGIPAEQQPEIFGRFVRGDSSRSRRAGSTGLGLAIVAAVVSAHRGRVMVTSNPGDTTFTVVLPAVSELLEQTSESR